MNKDNNNRNIFNLSLWLVGEGGISDTDFLPPHLWLVGQFELNGHKFDIEIMLQERSEQRVRRKLSEEEVRGLSYEVKAKLVDLFVDKMASSVATAVAEVVTDVPSNALGGRDISELQSKVTESIRESILRKVDDVLMDGIAAASRLR